MKSSRKITKSMRYKYWLVDPIKKVSDLKRGNIVLRTFRDGPYRNFGYCKISTVEKTKFWIIVPFRKFPVTNKALSGFKRVTTSPEAMQK